MKRKILLLTALFMSFVGMAQFTYVEPTLLFTPVNTNHVKVIITADGFQQADYNKFFTLAQTAAHTIRSTEPFSNRQGDIGFYSHFIPSVDSGIGLKEGGSVPAGSGVTKNTVFGMKFNGDGQTLRLITTDMSTRSDMDTYFGQFDNVHQKVFVICIVNEDSEYGGSGELPSEPVEGVLYDLPVLRETSLSVITSSETWYGENNDCQTSQNGVNAFKFLALHEFGHSFCDLDDEYVDAAQAAIHDYSRPNKKNIRSSYRGGLFEHDKFEYEGARYKATGKWRRELNGNMRGGVTSTGSAPYKTQSRPMTFDNNTRDDINNVIDQWLSTTQLVSISITTNGKYNASDVCFTTDALSNKYVTWLGVPYAHYVVGQKIYNNQSMTQPFQGNSKWFFTNEDTAVRVASDGTIMEIDDCSTPPGGGRP